MMGERTVMQEATVRRRMVGGEGFVADARLIHADANRQRSADGSDDVDWDALAASRRSVREYLDTLDDAAWGRRGNEVIF